MLTKLDKKQRFHTNKLNKQKQIFSKKKKKNKNKNNYQNLLGGNLKEIWYGF